MDIRFFCGYQLICDILSLSNFSHHLQFGSNMDKGRKQNCIFDNNSRSSCGFRYEVRHPFHKSLTQREVAGHNKARIVVIMKLVVLWQEALLNNLLYDGLSLLTLLLDQELSIRSVILKVGYQLPHHTFPTSMIMRFFQVYSKSQFA